MARHPREPFVAPPLPESGPVATPKAQWTGAAVIAAVAIVFAAGAPAVATRFGARHLSAGETLTVSGSIEITAAGGWQLADGDGSFFTQLVHGDATYTPIAAAEIADYGDARETIESQVTAFENDASTTWDIGEVTSFTSDHGDTGFRIEATSPAQVQVVWVVEDGTYVTSHAFISPADQAADALPGAEAMARSVVILGAAS